MAVGHPFYSPIDISLVVHLFYFITLDKLLLVVYTVAILNGGWQCTSVSSVGNGQSQQSRGTTGNSVPCVVSMLPSTMGTLHRKDSYECL